LRDVIYEWPRYKNYVKLRWDEKEEEKTHFQEVSPENGKKK